MRSLFTKITLILCTLMLSVNMWGNTVSSANSSSDVKNGKIEMKGNHATFYLSDISTYEDNWRSSWAYVIGTVKKSSSKTLTLSWTTDGDYDIKVTNIRLYAKAYTSGEWAVHNGKIIVAGSEYTIGTIRVSTGGFDEINKSGNFTSDISIVCKNNESGIAGYSFDYFIKDITITYTATPKIKTKKGNVEVTICPEAPKTIDLNTCLTNKDNHLSYTFSCTAEGANIEEATFSASRIGDYTVNVSVEKKSNCHEAASTTFIVTVTPAALTLTPPTASDITYRQALSASDLTGGSAKVGSCVVDGSWAWKASTTVPSMPGDDQPFPVVFTPFENAGNYTGFETNALVDVKRAQFIFDGSGEDEEKKENWVIVDNWQSNADPGEEDVAIIRHDVIIAAEVAVYSLQIEGESKVTVAPTGGLTVGAGGVIGATKDNLKLKAGTSGVEKGQTGYLRISPEYTSAMPEATVEMLCQGYSNAYTKNNFASGTMMWQYLGAPVKLEGTKIKSVVPGWINSWDEETGAWVNNRSSVTFVPFKGFANSQNFDAAGVLATYSGLLIDNDIHPVDLTHGESEMAGWNLLANSFAAPIDIKKMFEYNGAADVENTVYIFNASTGTYTPVTKANAGSTVADVDYQGVIPSMQGFFIKANSDCTFSFDYTSMVWEANYTGLAENTPMRVNKRYSDEAEKQVVSVTMEANGQTDKVLLIESEEYDIAFENGYDAHYMPVGGFNIFAVEEEDHLAIDATNSIIGTRLGVRTGEETAYTMTFNYVDSENNLLLWDIEADEKIAIREGGMYTFFIEPNSMNTGRFVIIEAEAPTVTTGVDNASESGAKVHKFIKDNQLYILKNGVLYNGTGARVK